MIIALYTAVLTYLIGVAPLLFGVRPPSTKELMKFILQNTLCGVVAGMIILVMDQEDRAGAANVIAILNLIFLVLSMRFKRAP